MQFATLLQLYKRRGWSVRVHYEQNKTGVWQAAGIEYWNECCSKRHTWPYTREFNRPKIKDGVGNKTFHNLNTEVLPDLGDRDRLWDELCQINLEDSFDKVITDEHRAEVSKFLEHLDGGPIVLLHTRGSNFAEQKSLHNETVDRLYTLLTDAGCSVVALDWDNRVPMPMLATQRHLKRDWGHISVTQTAALFERADLLIGIDSGPYHLAAMTRLPALGVFHEFSPYAVTLPRASGRNAVLTRHKTDIDIVRRKRWCPITYHGDQPTAEDIACHALRMLEGSRYGMPIGKEACFRGLLDRCHMAIIDRDRTWDTLFRALTAFTDPQIVETGCVRSPEDWSAGYSTYLFGYYLDARNTGALTSVDIDRNNCHTARRLCADWSRVSVVESDSVAYLLARTDPIDCLYLDSMDADLPGHAEHGLAELQAAERLLHGASLVAVDDTTFQGGWRGKGALAVPYLLGKGWKILSAGYQVVMHRPEAEATPQPVPIVNIVNDCKPTAPTPTLSGINLKNLGRAGEIRWSGA